MSQIQEQSISQIDYWKDSDKPNKPNKPDKNTHPIKDTDGGQGATYLSYDVYLGLSVLGGIFALDHLYLRSPLTFIAKIIVNILTLGSWWIYDASQAVFNRDVVKIFGAGIPGIGPYGIGAGVLANDIPDKKHMSFFVYSIALLMGGLFGLDSFVVGDKQSGFIRLISLITGIFAPIAIFWWLFNIGKFFFKTKDVTSEYWEYFGAPPPAEYGMTIGERVVSIFPFLEYIVGPITTAKNVVVGATDTILSTVNTIKEAALENPVNTAKRIITEPIEYASQKVENVVGALDPGIKQTLNNGIATVQSGVNAVEDGISLGRTALNVVSETAKEGTKVLALAPGAASMSQGFTPAAASAALNKMNQHGGGLSSQKQDVLPYMMIGTFLLIIALGFATLFPKTRQKSGMFYTMFNKNEQSDDSPPEPGVLRESNKEKSGYTA
jgi:hypothetical protein